MPGTPFNPYQNLPSGNKVTPVNKGNPAQIGAAIGNVLGNNPSNPTSPTALFSGSFKTVMYWGIAALALIALAKPYPSLSTGFVVLLIVGVLLTHYQQYMGLLSPPSK